MELILNSMQTTGVYVIKESDHRILYFNKRVKEVSPNVCLGMACHELWAASCPNCPLLQIGNKKESRSINYASPFGNVVEIAATRIQWGGDIPAFLIMITPHVEVASYTYSKILRANLTTDSFELIKSEPEDLEMMNGESMAAGLDDWFNRFLEAGNVFGRDEERFRKFTAAEYLKDALKSGKKILTCTYRRKTGKGYRWHTMEVVPDYDYTAENQSIRLYVKDMHDMYRHSLELEDINKRNQDVIKSLGEVNYGIYLIDLFTGAMHPVRMPADLEGLVEMEYMDWDNVWEESVQSKFHPQYGQKMLDNYSLKALREAWEKGEQKKEMLCQRMFDQSYHYVSVTAHFHDSGSHKGLVVLAFQDVDEETRKEINRNRNLMRMATVIKSGYNTMSTVDLETGTCERIYLKMEDEAGRVHTGNYGEVIKNALEHAVYEEDAERFRAALSLECLREKAESVENFEEVKCQYRMKGAELIWVEAQIFFVRQADSVMVNILGRDITKQKKEEETAALEKRERNYIINAMGSLFFASYYIDLEANTFRMITQVKEVGDVLGVEQNCEEGFRKYAEHFVHPEDRQEYLDKMDCGKLQDVLGGGQPFMALEYRKINAEDGESEDYEWIRATVVLAEGGDGKAKKALYVAQDVTESKRKEEQERRMLKEACDAANHANASKSEFLSRMSHDIRTPMNAIIGMTSIAGAHLDEPERVSDCLGKITVSSKHLLSLINEVLDMSKIESGKINLTEEEFSLSDLVQNLLTILRPSVEAKRHGLEFHIRNVEHEDVIGDEMRLQQVLINILGNSVKYTPEGGHLQLELTEKKSSMVEYGCYEFVISDDGMGMTPEYVERIFEPFSRAEDSRISKIEGTGLGMAIALNIARKMSGDIHVESKVNEGSKFTVTVYLKKQDREMPDTGRLLALPVLVVDDDRLACEAACAVLDDIGMRSEWVLGGREAVTRVVRAHEEAEDFFAVILDWKMPDMDGLETARQIRRAVGDDVPIIILSAYDWSSVETEARQAGVNGFISKPLFKSRLVYLLKQLADDEAAEDDVPDGADAEQDFSGRRILLVEDNEINREIAEEVIGDFGVTVETAVDGKQAVDKFLEMGAWYYDLIFMDVQMPVINGYEATKAIRASGQEDAVEIPIVAMTANAFAEDVTASRKAGMSEHITKPLDIGQLKACMGYWLDKNKRRKK